MRVGRSEDRRGAILNALAQRLAALPKGTRIDWSDSWSDEDIEKFTAGAVKRLDTEDEP